MTRAAGDERTGRPLGGLIVVLWRADLRAHEALALNECDLDHRRGSLLVRRGKGGRRREVGIDERAWEHPQPWIDLRLELAPAPSPTAASPLVAQTQRSRVIVGANAGQPPPGSAEARGSNRDKADPVQFEVPRVRGRDRGKVR